MNQPLISIITTVYNAGKTIEATLKSVLNQDIQLFEYWIIDGGSKDGSVDIIRKYENQLAGWISEPDQGIYEAMNKGIDRVKGDWIFFLGADDLLIEGILSKVTSHLNSDLSVVYGDVVFSTGHVMHSYIDARSLLDNRLHHQGAFYHKRLFDNFRYNQKFSVYADYELTLRVYMQKQSTLYIPYIISIFAVGGISHELVSSEINTIRRLYVKSPILNSFLSFVLDIYYPYMTIRMKITRKLRKVWKLEKKHPYLKSMNEFKS